MNHTINVPGDLGRPINITFTTPITPEVRRRLLQLTEVVTDLGHWKSRCVAVVPEDWVDAVAEAMMFVGQNPDTIIRCQGLFPHTDLGVHMETGELVRVPLQEGYVAIHSEGYWAHDF